jgi:hypothetical protein
LQVTSLQLKHKAVAAIKLSTGLIEYLRLNSPAFSAIEKVMSTTLKSENSLSILILLTSSEALLPERSSMTVIVEINPLRFFHKKGFKIFWHAEIL